MLRKKILNGLFKLVMTIMQLFDCKTAIILMDHKLKIETVHKDEKENKRYYDPDHYINGNLYIKDKSNPVDIENINDKTNLISSDKYQQFFNIDVLEKIAKVSQGAIKVKGWAAMLIMLVINSIMSIFIFLSLMG